MKLTGKLKEKVSKAETKEQAKELIANAGMELTDEEVDMVSGGGVPSNVIKDMGYPRKETEQIMKEPINASNEEIIPSFWKLKTFG